MLVVILSVLLNSGAAVGALFLLLALRFFCQGAGLDLSLGQQSVAAAAVFAVPLAAFIAGILLERFSGLGGRHANLMPHLACLAAFALGLAADGLLDYCTAAVELALAPDMASRARLFTALTSNAVLCGGLIAFSIMLVQLAVELPFHWLCSAARLRPQVLLAPVRPLAVVLIAALAINLITGLLGQELWPANAIFGQIRR